MRKQYIVLFNTRIYLCRRDDGFVDTSEELASIFISKRKAEKAIRDYIERIQYLGFTESTLEKDSFKIIELKNE